MRNRLSLAAMAAVLLLSHAAAQPVELELPRGTTIGGADRAGDWIAVWGDRCLLTTVRAPRWTVVRAPSKPGFGEGGCLADVDGDGRPDVIVQESGGGLVWFQAPAWTRRVIDGGADAADVRFTAFDGRRGAVTIHRGGQIRFYQVSPRFDEAWPSRDLYSFYSASRQGGLLFTDVDGDGRQDVIAGNYWMRNPPEFDLPWRLFAIKLWSDQSLSALTRFALFANGDLAAAQRSLSPGRLAVYHKPADPRDLWAEDLLADDLDKPATLLTAGVKGDGQEDVVAAESGPKGRVFVFARGRREQVASGIPIVRAWLDGRELLAVTQQGLVRIPLQRSQP
ncbi:MAG: hypothetical protein ACKV22_13920 [Bryobacteraceae bacterium]